MYSSFFMGLDILYMFVLPLLSKEYSFFLSTPFFIA